ncbi:MAG: hypothetical protein V3S24_12895 [Candidatus Tectomicrobia bacterium]
MKQVVAMIAAACLFVAGCAQPPPPEPPQEILSSDLIKSGDLIDAVAARCNVSRERALALYAEHARKEARPYGYYYDGNKMTAIRYNRPICEALNSD